MSILGNIEPKKVFYYFEEISNIPRGSYNEKEVADYCVSVAKEFGLDSYKDDLHNVIIRKPATAGYENSPVVMLQCHIDMVNEKNSDKVHDFDTQGLDLIIDGDLIHADNTTLGADNGVAAAYCLAIAASNDIKHPALELVFTSQEETGMGGAIYLDSNQIKSRRLINLDSGNQDEFLVSCAGGIKPEVSLPIVWEQNPNCNEGICKEISVRGLKGGHSGEDIIKQRGNSNRLMFRILNAILSKLDARVSEISGGAKNNAIPREANAVICVKKEDENALDTILKECQEIFSYELKESDPEVKILLENASCCAEKVYTKETAKKAVAIGLLIPNGVQSMSTEIEGLVESSNNMGVIVQTEDELKYICAIRSSVVSKKHEICNAIVALAEISGAKCEVIGDYPGWAFNKDSELLKICSEVFKAHYKKEPAVRAIHAGLECGLFSEKLPGCDMISFGPNMWDIHTPKENVSISSMSAVYEFLLKILESMK